MSRLIRYSHKDTGGWLRSVIDTPHSYPTVAIEVNFDASREDILRALAGLTAAIKNDKEVRP